MHVSMSVNTHAVQTIVHRSTVTDVSWVWVVVKGINSQRQSVDVEKCLLIQRPVQPIRYVNLRKRDRWRETNFPEVTGQPKCLALLQEVTQECRPTPQELQASLVSVSVHDSTERQTMTSWKSWRFKPLLRLKKKKNKHKDLSLIGQNHLDDLQDFGDNILWTVTE